MSFSQGETRARGRLRRVEDFGFVMRGDFFWRHRSWYSVSSACYSLSKRVLFQNQSAEFNSSNSGLLPTASCLLVLRHHFLAILEKLTHFALLRDGQDLQPIRPSLFQLFFLHIGEFGKMIRGPTILDKLKRIIFAQRM